MTEAQTWNKKQLAQPRGHFLFFSVVEDRHGWVVGERCLGAKEEESISGAREIKKKKEKRTNSFEVGKVVDERQ